MWSGLSYAGHEVVSPFYLRASFLVPTIGGGTLALVMLVIQAIVRLKRRRQIYAYQQLAVSELQDARRVQMGLMPEVAPTVEGLQIAGRCVSANTVSGDFFDYLEGENQIAIVVGDVTGHGMQGAMNAVMTDGILHSVAKGQEILSSALINDATTFGANMTAEEEDDITVVVVKVK